MEKRATLALICVAILGAAVAAPARSSRAEPAADDCLGEPNRTAPQGSHWYYRTDRSTSRRCWYLAPQREKAKEAREVAPLKPRSSSRPASEPTAEPAAEPVVRAPEPVARTAEPVPDIPMQLQSLPKAAAPTEPEPAAASDRVADEPLEMRPQREEGEQIDKPSTRPDSIPGDSASAVAFDMTFEHMLALLAAALALAAVIVRKIFKQLAVRRLRRRRSALRSQWEAATHAPVPDASANAASTVRHAEVVHEPAAAPRSADVDRRPANSRDPGHDFADDEIDDRRIEEGLRRLLHDLRRAAA
jgi:hypothetical protein